MCQCPGQVLSCFSDLKSVIPLLPRARRSNPAFNTLTFTSADGATPTPAAVCNSVSMSQVICELEVPRDVAYAKTWTLGVNIIGYVVTSGMSHSARGTGGVISFRHPAPAAF